MLYAILLGALVGWLAGQITKGSGFGVIGNILIGIGGGFLGSLVFTLVGFKTTSIIGEIISGIIGAILLLWIIGKLRNR